MTIVSIFFSFFLSSIFQFFFSPLLLVISCFINASVVILVVVVVILFLSLSLSLCSYLDSLITNLSFDHFTGTIYLVDPIIDRPYSMITSSGTNPVDQLISNHHVALITQPVLAARSRSKKNRIPQSPSMDKDNLNSLSTHHRHVFNDSPQLILPVQRVKSII